MSDEPEVRVAYFGGSMVSTHPLDCRCGKCVPWAMASKRVQELVTDRKDVNR